MTVPRPIREVVSRSHSARRVGIHMPVSRGQIRVAQGLRPDDPVEHRLVLVLRVDERREFAEIMFVHPYTELATGSDLVVAPEHSSITYQVVVETDVRGVVWVTQPGSLVGVLEQSAIEAVGAVALGEAPDSPDLFSGLPSRGRFDRRWDFKAAEGSALRTLAAECTESLLDGQTLLQLDVGILSPVLLAACDDRESALLKLLDIISKEDVVFDLNDLEMLDDIGALEVDNWTDVFGGMGDQLYISLSPLIEDALSKGSDGTDPRDETSFAWVEGRKAEAGEFRPRLGLRVVSATYVRATERQLTDAIARDGNFELVDA